MIRRIRHFFQKPRAEQDLDQELRFHLERQIADYVDSGICQEEARRRAKLEFGGLERVKEEVRDTRWETHLEILLRDLKFGLRNLKKDRRFSFLAIFALALGIGSTTVVFSVFYNLLFDPFAYKDANRLVVVSIHDVAQAGNDGGTSYSIPEYVAIREQNHVFEDVAGGYQIDLLYDAGGGTHDTLGTYLTTNNFQFFGVPPFLGRWITEQDGSPGAPPVFVIGYKLWKNEFNGDPAIVGKTFTLNGKRRTLVGVMPPRFKPYGTLIWLPLSLSAGAEGTVYPGNWPVYLYTLGRLKPHVNLETASADLDVIARRLAKDYPKDFPERFTVSTPWVADSLMGPFKGMLYALLAAVLMLLLIACSNVANLLLARATVREREIAVRASLGASRGRLVRQLLAESFVLASAACIVGCIFAYFGMQGVMATIPQDRISGEAVIGLNPAVLLFSLVVTILTTFICGLAPGFHAVPGNLHQRLISSGRGASAGLGHGQFRSGLVIVEVALSIVLLAGAGLMMRSLFALTHVDLGFNPERVLYARLATPSAVYNRSHQKGIFMEQVLARVKALPGVSAATIAHSQLPLFGLRSNLSVFAITDSQRREAMIELCSDGYFQTLGLQLLRGKLLSQADVASTRKVAVVNQALAHSYFGNRDPLGQKIRFSAFDEIPEAPHDTYFEIIGVVTNFKNQGLQEPSMPEAFLPYTLLVNDVAAFLAKTTVDPNSLLTSVQREVWAVDPDVGVNQSGSIESFLELYAYKEPQFDLVTLGSFAGIGLLLVVIGIFSVMGYTVALRTREIGIRMALGAQRGNILGMVLKSGFALIAAGALIGLLGSFALTRFIASQIWGVSVTDPWTFGAVVAVILIAGLVACMLPARRATRVDPLVALRYE
jgi:putative ABC transport system permease protein